MPLCVSDANGITWESISSCPRGAHIFARLTKISSLSRLPRICNRLASTSVARPIFGRFSNKLRLVRVRVRTIGVAPITASASRFRECRWPDKSTRACRRSIAAESRNREPGSRAGTHFRTTNSDLGNRFGGCIPRRTSGCS